MIAPGGWVLSLVAALGLIWFRGGYQPLAEAGFTVLAGAALMLTPSSEKSTTVGRVGNLIWACWIAWQLLQLTPLPTTWLSHWAPASLAAWRHEASAEIFGSPRISVVPPESLRMLVSSLGLWCVWETTRRQLQVNRSLVQPTLLAILTVGLLQALLGTLTHLGVLSFPTLEPGGFVHSSVAHGSFANRNHFAAYMILCAAAALVLMLSSNPQRSTNTHLVARVLDFSNSNVLAYRVALLCLIIGVVLSQSRMGNMALAVSVALYGIVWILRSRNPVTFGKSLLLFASIAAVDVMLVSGRFGLDRVVERIEQTDIDGDIRAEMRQLSWQMLDRYSAAGAGLGSYPRLESQFSERLNEAPAIYAHNDHLQLLIEAGWPGYGLLGLLLFVHGLHGVRLLASSRRLHAAIGAASLMIILAALLHSSVEFLAYTPAWRALFVLLLGIVASIPAPRAKHQITSKRLGVENLPKAF